MLPQLITFFSIAAVMVSIEGLYPVSAVSPVIAKNSAVFTQTNGFKNAKYGLNIAFFPGIPSIPIQTMQPDGTWNRLVNSFDVAAFGQDVQATGAKYVIFSVSQTSGFYTAPSQVFLRRTGTKLGEYVPQRDLVQAIAKELQKYQIATLVYLAAEGPTAAPLNIRQTFPVFNDQASAETRSTLNAMVREWSQRWGKDVAGWWIDGAWVSGYTNPPDGRSNLNALIAAAKSGNPNALVAVNPGANRHTALTEQQDFLAGEELDFHRYPRQSLGSHRGKDIQWHTMSFLGNRWSDGATKYSNSQITNYIRYVNRLGGVVTMDVAINAKGRIAPQHLAQLAAVKKVIRAGAKPPINESLTRYKPVYLVSNSGTDRELPVNGDRYFRYGSYAVDGVRNLQQNAQASQEWAWSLLVDLQQSTTFQRAIVTFPPDNYPTHYQLLSSVNGKDWRVILMNKITKAGTYTHRFPQINARYVQVRALAPNGPNQTGNQMAISEFELYAR